MPRPLLERLRTGRGFPRSIACVVLITFTGLICEPTALALQRLAGRSGTGQTPVSANYKQFPTTIDKVRISLEALGAALERGDSAAAVMDTLSELNEKLGLINRQTMQDFSRIQDMIREKHLPDIILKRYRDTLYEYRRRMRALFETLRSVQTAKSSRQRLRACRRALVRIETYQPPRRHYDPDNMPNESLIADPHNKPRVKKEDFHHAGLHDNPYQKLAALGDFRFDQLPDADDPAYLAATVEVTLSDAVKAKAAELGYDPVQVYNWVRNSIEWVPTWGATQDADLTLSARRGNAFDISSLLIALLRASGVPARYVHGTIDVPAGKFKNWVGGFQAVAAASDFAASGGIPVTNIVRGGKIAIVRMEHIWVEAAIDYEPSRGAVNRSADSWVQMDPSYKQYQYFSGMDMERITGISGQQLAQDYVDSGSISPTGEWVQGFDPSALENAQTGAEEKINDYITANPPNANTDQVMGGREIIPRNVPVLPAAIPNDIVVIGARYAKLPNTLEHQVAFTFNRDVLGELQDPAVYPWPQINNHKVTLSFRPATPVDAQALQSLLPQGAVTDVSQLPQSIPSYLIHVVPELKIDEQVVKTGTPMELGGELDFAYSVTLPGRGTDVYPKPVVAGSFLSIAVVGGGVAPAALDTLKSSIMQSKSTLESGNADLIAMLTRDDLLGDVFYAGSLGYFAEYNALNKLMVRQQRAHHLLLPSLGTYGYEPMVQYIAGIPTAVEPGGVVMDMDRVAHVIGTDPIDPGTRRLINIQSGTLSSALENAIPEQMFGTSDQPVEAISAVKALSLANAQGQRIYHITPLNQTSIFPDIHHRPETMDEIRAALAVGKDVITHTDSIDIPGWSGAGYIIIDPVTGNAAYKIGGGFNGGVLNLRKFISPIMTFWETWDIAAQGNVVTGFSKALQRAGSMLSIVSFGIETLKVCANFVAAIIVMITFASSMLIISQLIGALALTPLGGILFGLLVGGVVNEVIAGIRYLACN